MIIHSVFRHLNYTTRKPSRSVFQPKEKPDVTLGTVIKDVSESISNVFTPDTTTQPKKQSEPIDIFKGLNDFLSSFNKPSIIPSANAEPKPEPEPTETKPELKKEESGAIKFVKENGLKIAGGIVGAVALGFVVLASVGTSQLGINDTKS